MTLEPVTVSDSKVNICLLKLVSHIFARKQPTRAHLCLELCAIYLLGKHIGSDSEPVRTGKTVFLFAYSRRSTDLNCYMNATIQPIGGAIASVMQVALSFQFSEIMHDINCSK